MTSFEKSYTLPESGSPAKIAYFENSPTAVIVTHPWGPLGGNMNNNVVMAVAQYFQRLGVTTTRFDFCGIQLGSGNRQVDQVKEVANVLLSGKFLSSSETKVLPTRILLVGYSYGSIICASATASIPQCIGMVWIAPPLGVRHWLYLFSGNSHLDQARQRTNLPQLMIMGSNDNFTSEDTFHSIVKTMPEESTTAAVLKNADHFFGRREKELLEIIGTYSRQPLLVYNSIGLAF
jgi:alpha/beta superfamily hydrolase